MSVTAQLQSLRAAVQHVMRAIVGNSVKCDSADERKRKENY